LVHHLSRFFLFSLTCSLHYFFLCIICFRLIYLFPLPVYHCVSPIPHSCMLDTQPIAMSRVPSVIERLHSSRSDHLFLPETLGTDGVSSANGRYFFPCSFRNIYLDISFHFCGKALSSMVYHISKRCNKKQKFG